MFTSAAHTIPLFVGILATMMACGGPGGASQGGGSSSSKAGAGGALPSGPAILIATDRGIEQIDTEGTVLRRISPTPARRPRLTGDGHLVFMARGFAELRRVKLNGTGERPLALIPDTVASSCDAAFPRPWDPALLLRADVDMQLDKGGHAVCMHFTVGEEDDISAAWVRVDLPKSGRGTLSLVCGVEPPPTDFQCKPGKTGPQGKRPSGKYEVRQGAIVEKSNDRPVHKLASGTLEEAAWTPFAPWSLVVAAVKRGKFIQRHVLALDRKSGSVYEIAPGPWPKPISDKRWQELGRGKNVSRSVALQSDIRALDHDGLFVVDTLLIVPGKRVVDTRGQFAR